MGRSNGPALQGGLVQQRPEDLSGDYAYDLAHEDVFRGRPPEHRPEEHPGPSRDRRQVELDQDMSYDEAHDF
jgi:hypothetical protein